MRTKRKVLTAEIEPVPSTRADGVPEHEWSREQLDQRWEQIRLRGEQISANIAALRARIISH